LQLLSLSQPWLSLLSSSLLSCGGFAPEQRMQINTSAKAFNQTRQGKKYREAKADEQKTQNQSGKQQQTRVTGKETKEANLEKPKHQKPKQEKKNRKCKPTENKKAESKIYNLTKNGRI